MVAGRSTQALGFTSRMTSTRSPACEAALAELRAQVPSLPRAYLEYLARVNGCEGDLGVEPGWVELWPAERVVENNTAYHVAEYLPGYFAFGSNGGGEMFVFRLNGTEVQRRAVYTVPFIPMQEAEIGIVTDNFEDFAAAIGKKMSSEA
jgi:hypothetical protein